MNRTNLIWMILFVIGGVFLLGRAMFSDAGMAKVYVREVQVNPDSDNEDHKWLTYENASPADFAAAVAVDPNQTEVQLSLPRTIGVWIAALFTLFVLSFLFGDNPFYKVAESVFVGVSAAYWMVVGFWATIVPNLIGKISPDLIRNWAMPGLGQDEHTEWAYLVPLALGVMLLWRLAPVGGWISRWPMAFIIGVFCGLRLITFIHADFLTQIRNTIVSLYATDPGGTFDLWASVSAIILVLGVLACLTYFFFSFEHKGALGGTARVGIWVLMVTFGAAFGYTVMGRIALLAIRIEFLFDDWLWLIDPTGKRVAEAAALLWYQVPGIL